MRKVEQDMLASLNHTEVNMGWAEWWLIGLVAGFLWRCIYEALNYDMVSVPKWGLTIASLVLLVVFVYVTAVALERVFG